MTTESKLKLFSPFKLGAMELSHRVVMAPLTRLRSNPDDSPSDMMIKHYCQRASEGGLIIIESAAVSPFGRGYLGAPGIYADHHIAGFKKIADTVHTQGGRVFLQLYHSGRTSHVSLQPDGGSPVAPSVVPYNGVSFTTEGFVPASPMRELGIEEIPGIIEAYRQAARRCLEAGLDGVELHSANGYLMDQFLQDGSNKRTDAYGGSIENRARFMLEVTEALVSVWGRDRVGVRVGPSGTFNEMSDSNPEALFGYVAEQLNRFGLAYLHVIEPRIKGDVDKENSQDAAPVASAHLRKIFKGPILAAGGFTRESAEDILEKGDADLVAFGRTFAANPDLPRRLQYNLPMNPYDRSAFWGGTERGYNDYPFYEGKGENCFAHELQI
jgi:N-ethylmaleimide reductase